MIRKDCLQLALVIEVLSEIKIQWKLLKNRFKDVIKNKVYFNSLLVFSHNCKFLKL